jgi:anti-anti-sigma regulatory factor
MLRITTHNSPELVTLQLEGRLAGPWVRELQECWQHASVGERTQAVRFDLSGVTFVDAAGKEFLAARYSEGAELVAAGCLMKAIVAEITR